jgi:hypothetical protein
MQIPRQKSEAIQGKGSSTSQQPQNCANRNTKPADAGNSTHSGRVNRDVLEIQHLSLPNIVALWPGYSSEPILAAGLGS